MDTREIMRQAQAGTLIVPEEVDTDPWFGIKIGDRVAYCSVGYLPSLPFIRHLPEREGWIEWLKMADTGTIVGLVTIPYSWPTNGVLDHQRWWATTAQVEWDNGKRDYIKLALCQTEDAGHPIAKSHS